MSQYAATVTMLSPNDSGVRAAPPSLIIVHTNEGPADGRVEDLLAWLQRREAAASYTMVVGRDGRTGRSNDDKFIPWAAGSPANEKGLHLCMIGRARQTRAEWLGPGRRQLEAAAEVAADWCKRYNIRPTWLTGADMRAGRSGIGGHDTTVAAWQSTDHTDPGAGFPRAEFVQMINRRLTGGTLPEKGDDMNDADRKMLREVWEQLRGPNGKGWPQLGTNDKGEALTLVDAIADLRAKAGK